MASVLSPSVHARQVDRGARDAHGLAPPLVRLKWFLQPTNAVIQVCVTLLYYALSHDWEEADYWSWEIQPIANIDSYVNSSACPPNQHPVFSQGITNYPTDLTFLAHALNSIVAALDLLISGRRNPQHVSHFIGPLGVGVAYVTFTIIYFAAGGTAEDGCSPYIYEALDWRSFGSQQMADGTTCASCTVRLVTAICLLAGVPCISLVLYLALFICRGERRGKQAGQVSSSGAEAAVQQSL